MRPLTFVCKELQLKLMIDPPQHLCAVGDSTMYNVYNDIHIISIQECTCDKCRNSSQALRVRYTGESDSYYYLQKELVDELVNNFLYAKNKRIDDKMIWK